MGNVLVDVVLPLSLAFIMFSLGIGLTFADFSRVLTRPKAFALGAVNQLVLLPVIAYGIVILFGMDGPIAVGFMLLSFLPGGITSNVLAKYARGDVALSVTLTAVISLVVIVTVPFLVTVAVRHFQGESFAAEIPVAGLAVKIFLLTTVPVLIGLAVRRFATGFARRAEPWISRIANILFAIVVVQAFIANWSTVEAQIATLGPSLVALTVVLLALGWFSARLLGFDRKVAATISVETGLQNVLLGLTVAAALAGYIAVETVDGYALYALPAGVYALTMYIIITPFIVWRQVTARDED
ncbi:bile acid:sodium symporter family protein [Minwuia sp.]|uniref:bile acid:sodium symporter family protein n=1 Tax=Minwuia sp. TaxID=2493630 RepID=UPI003A953FB1